MAGKCLWCNAPSGNERYCGPHSQLGAVLDMIDIQIERVERMLAVEYSKDLDSVYTGLRATRLVIYDEFKDVES